MVRRRWLLRAKRGRIAEQRAASLLERRGYRIVASQVEWPCELLVDGRETRYKVRGDYLVERRGRTYLAEVKSGAQATRIENPATRRQVLEYLSVFPVSSVLLVDMESETVSEIRRKEGSRHPLRRTKLLRWAAAGALLVFAGVGMGIYLASIQ